MARIENYHLKRLVNIKNDSSISKEFKVCCTGGLSESRGIEQLIDACYNASVK